LLPILEPSRFECAARLGYRQALTRVDASKREDEAREAMDKKNPRSDRNDIDGLVHNALSR
jgi:hypothetical protein